MQDPDLIPQEEKELFLQYRDRVKDTNISDQTLLATDYLNHFNEIIMLIGMVPDMPDILEECKEWAPKAYQDHFADSNIADKDLAVEVYPYVPERYRKPFEETIRQMNNVVEQSIRRMVESLESDDMELLTVRAHAASHGLQKLNDVASSIIHGSDKAMSQEEIDGLLGI